MSWRINDVARTKSLAQSPLAGTSAARTLTDLASRWPGQPEVAMIARTRSRLVLLVVVGSLIGCMVASRTDLSWKTVRT